MTNRPYEIGKWYKVACKYFIASANAPVWGLVKIKEEKRRNKFITLGRKAVRKRRVFGWLPQGKLFSVSKNDLIMIMDYILNDEIVVFGIDDKILYTEVAELKKINALTRFEYDQSSR